MTDDDLRSILHHATHAALPPVPFITVQARAHIQVRIADFVIGAIRASEHGADSFGSLHFDRDSDGSPKGGDGEASSVHDSAGPQDIAQPTPGDAS